MVAPEGSDACVHSGTDGVGNVSNLHSPPLSLQQTCYYQRKDSPVEAFTLSPEPLESEGEDRNGGMGRQRESGKKNNGKMRESKERVNNEEKR